MVLSSAAEHRLCTEVIGNLFLPPQGLVLRDAVGREEGSWQGFGARSRLEVPHPSVTLQARHSLQIFLPGSC